jgi:hypothetical protein
LLAQVRLIFIERHRKCACVSRPCNIVPTSRLIPLLKYWRVIYSYMEKMCYEQPQTALPSDSTMQPSPYPQVKCGILAGSCIVKPTLSTA